MAWTPRRLILLGAATAAAGLLLAALGAGLGGSLNPACAGARAWNADCLTLQSAASLAFKALGIPVMIAGGLMIAMGLARRDPIEEPPAERRE